MLSRTVVKQGRQHPAGSWAWRPSGWILDWVGRTAAKGQHAPEVGYVGLARGPDLKYNKDQWISSFEDAILRLRPHLTTRILNSITGMAWQRYGVKGEDPKKAAEQWSAGLDR